jgi:acetolactate synthase-1/2/3 large subunit
MKYSDYFIESLVELGYTHCFFVGGGNVMHLLESARTRMECVAVVHEVSAGIAAEYFNVANRGKGKRAFAMVTAGPGITNLSTAIGGAWLESRELLVVGGQARTDFLSHPEVRQIGHQQIDGRSIVEPMSKLSMTVIEPLGLNELKNVTDFSRSGRKGPVFLEICLDITAMEVDKNALNAAPEHVKRLEPKIPTQFSSDEATKFTELLKKSSRPLFLVGGGLDFQAFVKILPQLSQLGIPVATTWNAVDYLDFDHPLYAGRPNTYGMRWANGVIQQADLVITLGARLGLQQTGFAWQEFAPVGNVVRIELDSNELGLDQPKSFMNINMDAANGLTELLQVIEDGKLSNDYSDWCSFISELKNALPVVEAATFQYPGFTNPFEFVAQLGDLLNENDRVVTCSSGGAYTTMMQVFAQKQGQLLTNNKGLASMGYGLAGAIGTALENPAKRTVLVEGDGGFAQNLSELGTVQNRALNLKIFIFSNKGYASIRVSQKAYFAGAYIGCDAETGVGLPDWAKAFDAYGIPSVEISGSMIENKEALRLLRSDGPAAFIVNVHPDQSFLPKITSRISSDGKMKSNPIHLMDPQLDETTAQRVFRFLPDSLKG